MPSSRPLESLTAADFLAVKGSRFRLAGARFEFELADVTEAAASRSAAIRTQFSVLFHGPIEPVLPQAIYHLESDQLGALDLFLVPIGPDPESGPGERTAVMRYEAVFG